VLSAVEAALIDHFGSPPARASVSFVGVEPIEVLRFEPIPGERAYLTLGMSRRPMTGADAEVLDAAGPRGELMLHVRDAADRDVDVWRRLALLAAAPAVEGVVYRDDMSVDLGEPLVAGSACTGVVILPAPIDDVPVQGGSVRIWSATPATANELAWCRVRGVAALRERWADQDVDLLDLHRSPARLD
jgi:hypothetical protein